MPLIRLTNADGLSPRSIVLIMVLATLFCCVPRSVYGASKTPSTSSGVASVSQPKTYNDPKFNGSITVRTDGGLVLSMRDGSYIIIGPRARIDPRVIGRSKQLTFRRDYEGKIIFAADPKLILIYTFSYSRDKTWVTMTDPENMYTKFQYDESTGRIMQIYWPSGRSQRIP